MTSHRPPRALDRAPLALVGLLALGLVAGARADEGPDLARPVPLADVPAALRAEVGAVTGDPSVACPLPARPVACRPETFAFLLARLPLAARALDALALEETGRYDIEDRPGGRFRIDDRAGASALCERAVSSAGLLVVVARGRLEVPVLPAVEGTGVIVVRWEPDPAAPGAIRCACRVDFRLASRLLHGLTAPLRRVLAEVLREKLDRLVASAAALAALVDRDPTAVARALERADAPASERAAFREAFLLH